LQEVSGTVVSPGMVVVCATFLDQVSGTSQLLLGCLG